MLNNPIDNVYLAVGATDLRKSIGGLAVLVTESLSLDPFSSYGESSNSDDVLWFGQGIIGLDHNI